MSFYTVYPGRGGTPLEPQVFYVQTYVLAPVNPYLIVGASDWPLTPAPPPIFQNTTWRQVHMLGQDRMIVGDQVYDRVPAAPPRLSDYTWIQSPTRVVQIPFAQFDWPLPRSPYRLDQTWTWRQVGMLGQDQLPVGEQIYDLVPKPPQRLPLYSTEWNQTGMIGLDRLPVGKITYELPNRGPYKIEQTWVWRQVGMLGQDQLPTGDQVLDLWPKPAPRLFLYTWEWNQVGMLGQDKLPVGDQIYDLTGRPWRLEQTWTLNLQETTLAPFVVPQQVIARIITDLPVRAAKPIDPTWVWNQTGMIGQDILPENQYDWPLPGRPPRIEQTTTWNQTPMLGQDRLPVGAQIHVLWTKAPPPIDQTWTWRQTIMLGKDILPLNQFDWPLPKGPRTTDYRAWEWRQVGMLGQDQMLAGDQIFDRPVPAPQRAIELYNWVQSVNLSLTVAAAQIPFNQYDWPVPKAAQQAAPSWTWRQVDKIGQDVLPKNQTDWPLPGRPSRIEQTTAWNQTPMLGRDQMLVGQQVYDRPIPAPKRTIDLYNWIQSVNLTLVGVVLYPLGNGEWPLVSQVAPQQGDLYSWTQSTSVLLRTIPPFPKNQYDWPVPRAPQQAALSWTWRQVDKLGLDRLPQNQFDWPLPNRGPAQFTRDWSWRQVGMLGQDRLPVGDQVYDRLIGAPQRTIDLYNWIQSVNLSLITVFPLRSGEWPLTPQAISRDPYSWAQSTNFNLLIAAPRPAGQQVYDRPIPGPLRAADLRTWIESVNLALILTVPRPLNAGDWPLTPAAAPLNVGFAWNGTIRTPIQVLPINIARSSTDLPQRGPFQPDRSSTYTSPFIPVPPVITAAQYFLLQPHYIFDRLLPAWTIVTEGIEIPVGWVPTLMVDPLNAQAVAAFYAAGPRTGYQGPGYDWQGPQYTTAQRQASIQSPQTFWVQSSPGMFKLTGLGTALPPVGG